MSCKNRQTDVLLICKGWFNKNHPDIESAIKKYIEKYTGLAPEHVTTTDILNFLMETGKDYFSFKNYERIVSEISQKVLRLQKEPIILSDIVHIYISEIQLLPMLDEKDAVIIDLTAYEENERII